MDSLALSCERPPPSERSFAMIAKSPTSLTSPETLATSCFWVPNTFS
jgi:hypothetical protein